MTILLVVMIFGIAIIDGIFCDNSGLENVSISFIPMPNISKVLNCIIPDELVRNSRSLLRSGNIWAVSDRIFSQVQAISLLLQNGDVLIEVDSGIGLNALTLWQYRSALNGVADVYIVFIQERYALNEILASNIAMNGFWSLSLLVTGDTCDLFSSKNEVSTRYAETPNGTCSTITKLGASRKSISSEDDAPARLPAAISSNLSHIQQQVMNGQCPALIRFGSPTETISEKLVCSLVSSVDLLIDCHPVIYMEISTPNSQSDVAVQFLRSLKSVAYSLFWQWTESKDLELRCNPGRICRQRERNLVGLLAVPHLKINSKLMTLVDSPQIGDLLLTKVEEVVELSNIGEDFVKSDEKATVWLVDLLDIDSTFNHAILASCSSDALSAPYSAASSLLPPSLCTLSVNVPSSTDLDKRKSEYRKDGIDSEYLKDNGSSEAHRQGILRLSSLQCSLWIAKIGPYLQSIARGDALDLWRLERAQLISACSQFLQRRLLLLRELTSTHQEMASGIIFGDRNYSSLLLNEQLISDNNAEASGELLFAKEPFHFNLRDSCGELFRSKFLCLHYFLNKYFKTIGEPVFCDHTKVFQRRIRAWQFPDDPSSYEVSVEQWPRRSCSQAKFLVFEPPSDQHGIGSMLEVIAAAFRFAICLDRILILQPVEDFQVAIKS